MLFPLDIPPGLAGDQTTYQSKGRWRSGNLVRWFDKALGPIGGWVSRSGTVSGKARCMITWRDNNAARWIGIMTHTGVYAAAASATSYSDITPVGFTAGDADSTAGSGYGGGLYGTGTYGTARADTSVTQEATVGTMDTFGQYLVFCNATDGKIYQWTLNIAVVAAVLSNAPTGCRSIVVTGERSLMALGASSDPRLVAWSDLEDNNVWTPSSTNQAGDFPLETTGTIQCGRRVSSGVLILTTTDAWLASYVNAEFAYGFQQIGKQCGVISQGAMVSLGDRAFWMSKGAFFAYDGNVTRMVSERDDYVFSDINLTQGAKVTCFNNSAFGEIWWFYPSGGSTENDRYAIYNYNTGYWNGGELSRLCAADRGVFTNPIAVDASGNVYDHETGYSYGGATPYAITGPIELGAGDQVMMARKLIPDEDTLGQVSATFYARYYPTDSTTEYGPYTLANRTDIRLSGRTVEMKIAGVAAADWRVGTNRLDIVPRGGR